MNTKNCLVLAAVLFGAFGLAQPAAAQEGVRLGNNNRITQDGTLKGAATALAFGGSTAMNGVASIMSSGSVRLGNNNQITQKGDVKGALTALAFGGSTAMNGVASIVSGK